MANVLKDAKVGFLTGLQKSVDTMLSQGANAGAKHGYFYLTKDSHRLYVGNSDGSLSAVNEGVQTVTYLNDLPVLSSADDKVAYTGRFFYVQYKDSSAGQVASNVANILCVYNGSSWVQINANTNTLIKSTEFATAIKETDVATVTNTITDTDGAKKTGDFTITGAGGLKVTATGKNVTITGDKYTLSAADGQSREVNLKLTSNNGQGTTTVTLKSDPETTSLERNGNTITIRGRANNEVTIANGDNSGFKVSVKDSEGKTVTGTYDPVIKYGGSGGSTAKLEKGVFTLSAYNKAEVDQLLRDLNAMEYRGTVGQGGSAATTWTACIALRQKIGYTYLFTSDLTIDGHRYTAGTLAIARGVEYTPADLSSGVITDASLIGTINPTTLDWDFVESTNDTDTTYRLITNGDGVGFALKDSIGGTQGEIKFKGENGLTITEDQTGANAELRGLINTIKVSHDTVGRNDSKTGPSSKDQSAATNAQAQLSNSTPTEYVNDTITIPVITKVNTNAQGHVTGINTVNYQLNDTGTCITGLQQSATATSNKATITTKIEAKNVAGKNMVTSGTATSTFSTSSLTIGASGNNVSIDMTWGEF